MSTSEGASGYMDATGAATETLKHQDRRGKEDEDCQVIQRRFMLSGRQDN